MLVVNEAVETPEEPQAAGTEGPAARLLLPAPPLLRVPGLFTLSRPGHVSPGTSSVGWG